MKNQILIALTALLCFTLPMVAQTYELRGKIVDQHTEEPLPGAAVQIKSTSHGVAADLDGHFRLPNLQRGEIVLTISYLSYEIEERKLKVPEDIGESLTFRLKPVSTALGEVVVTGSFEGQQRALNQQRAADNIKNIVSADLIGKFPDKNVAESLQRLPGINILRDKGEGSTVSIRGTPQHFTNISINGEQLASVQQSGARTEALDLIPADQLGSIEITKALTADMDGDAIGGNVNLRTPTALTNKWRLRGDIGSGFNDLAGNLNYIGKLQISRRFFPAANSSQGRLGVLVSGSYYTSNNAEDRVDARWSGVEIPVQMLNRSLIVPEDYQFRKTENNRTRVGLTATIDYKVKNHEVIFNYMYNYREDDDNRNRLRFDFNRTSSAWVSLDSLKNGRIRRNINIWNEAKKNHNFNLEGTSSFGNWTIDWGAFYTISRRDYRSIRADFARDEIAIVADNERGILAPVPQFRPETPHNLKNPLLLNDFRRYEEDMEYTRASNAVAKINIKKDYRLMNYNGLFQFGAKVRAASNGKFRDNRVFAFFDPNAILNLQEAFARVASNTEPIRFLNGRYEYGPKVDKDKLTNYIDTYRRLLITADDAWDAERLSKNDTYTAAENVYAAYLMNKIQLRNLLLITGLRYEHNRVGYDAFDVKRTGTTIVATPISENNSYGFLLPSLHAKYSFNRFTNLRLAYTHSYAKPNFVDLVPFVNHDTDALRLYLGNPKLKPSLAKNIDLMFEKYDRNGGIFSGGLFFKHIDKFQFSRIIPVLLDDFPGYPNTVGFEFKQEQNGDRAIVYGLEVNYMQQFIFFPAALKGLSAYLNYTFTASNAGTQDRKNMRLPGQAMHTANAALSWDYKGFSIKPSLNYNGAFIESVASTPNDDIIQDERLQLDVNLSQQISKKIRLYAELMNLTNAPSIRYQGNENQISRIAYFGWSARFGASFRL